MAVTSPALGRQGAGLLSAEQIRELATLSPRGRIGNFAYLGCTWALIGAAFAVAGTWPRWWVVVLAFLVVSSRQQALLNIEHDCIHASFT
ncbi:MAG TPA: hypothetical protein VHE56_06060, partial [Mycobacteriales bacterium]|nr:hypothetical protein [Mycobacteriales bacterium]